MRIAREMEIYRYDHPMYGRGDRSNGCFKIPSRGLRIIASDGGGWDHVSVSLEGRCPTWDEMQWVRTKFFDARDTVLQYHPPLDVHINHHPYCLHLWRKQETEVALPPLWMIA